MFTYKVLNNIFTIDECESLIEKYEQFLDEEFELANGKYCRYDFKDSQLADLIYNKIRQYIDMKINNKFYLSKYNPNSSYIGKHVDGNIKSYDNVNNYISQYTFIVYLNDDFDNGHTIFNKDNKYIKPIQGNILILRQDVIHEAEPPQSGCKYILRGDLLIKC